MNPGTGMNGGEARNGMVEQKFVSVMYSDLEGPPIFTDCCFQLGPFPTCNLSHLALLA